MFLIVSCHESRKSMRLARNRRRSNYDCLTDTDCLKVMVVVREPQQFSMFGRKIPCETGENHTIEICRCRIEQFDRFINY